MALAAVAMTFAFNLVPTRTEVGCYSDLSLDSDIYALVNVSGSATEACEEAWSGQFLTNPAVPRGEVPPLTGCINDVGVVVVFPTDNPGICNDLGLAGVAPGQSDRRLATIAGAIDDIDLFIAEVPCRPLDESAEGARRILRDRGLASWSVVIQGERPDRPCASLAVDTPSETIIIVAIPAEE